MSGVVVPDGWEVKALKDILTIQYGKDQKEVESEDGKYPILGSGGVIGYTNYFLYDQASVLIGRKGTINNPQYMETPFWTVDTLFYSHIKNNNVPKWVYYVFQSINWNSYNEASGVPSLSTSNINKIEILRPPQKEQEKIAKILSTLDKNIENTSKIIEKEKNIKKALMQELLTNGIDKNAKIRSPKTHSYKQSKLGLIPEEWEIKKVCHLSKTFAGGTPNRENSNYYNGIIPWVKSGEVNQPIITKTEETITQDGLNNSSAKFVEKGTILVAMYGATAGKIALLNIKATTNQAVLAVPLKNDDILFIINMLEQHMSKLVFQAQGSGQPNLSKQMVDSMLISVPSITEQKQIAKILSTQDKKIESEQKNLSKLQELKKGLMSDLLSGKVRVKI